MMLVFVRFKKAALLMGDIAIFYLSLGLTLAIRYQRLPSRQLWEKHVWPFSFVFALWLIIFYIAELYNLHRLKNNFEFNQRWGIVLLVNTVLAIVVFYFLPSQTGLTPKTNLVLLAIVFGVLGFLWRRWYNTLLHQGQPEHRVVLIGDGPIAEEIAQRINHNPQLGYHLRRRLEGGLHDQAFTALDEIIREENINLIVIPAHIKKNSAAAKKIYRNLARGVEVTDLAALYGSLFQKVPLSELEEVWFLENLTRSHKLYDSLKRPFEAALALTLSVVLIVPALIIALLVRMTSAGPLFVRQRRVGQNEREFILYKFRSMRADAEQSGPQWSNDGDPRVTPVGRLLRFSHLDELPQLINIIRGELSFVGPRPERLEFVRQLKKTIPYYDLRHLVRPGLTGWAQINFRYGSTSDDAYEKLQYDIYYLKNYSFWLDVSILIKTARLFFTKLK